MESKALSVACPRRGDDARDRGRRRGCGDDAVTVRAVPVLAPGSMRAVPPISSRDDKKPSPGRSGDGLFSLTHATPVSPWCSEPVNDPLTTRGHFAALIDGRGIRRGNAVAVVVVGRGSGRGRGDAARTAGDSDAVRSMLAGRSMWRADGGLTTVDEFAAFEPRGSSAIRGVAILPIARFAGCGCHLCPFSNMKNRTGRLIRPVRSL